MSLRAAHGSRSFLCSVAIHGVLLTVLAVLSFRNHDSGSVHPSGPRVTYLSSRGGGGREGLRPTDVVETALVSLASDGTMTPTRRARPVMLHATSLAVPDIASDFFAASDVGVTFDASTLPPGLNVPGGLNEPSSGTGKGTGGGHGEGYGPDDGNGFTGDARGWDRPPRAIYEHPVVYPEEAKHKSVAGEVLLQILVRTDGTTRVLGVLKSLPFGCVEAAKDAAERYRFRPALKDGKKVDATGILSIRFHLYSPKT